MECCCRHKHTKRTEEETKSLVTRLNRIEGQIRGIRKMVEENVYCNDILVQASAANAALHSFSRELLDQHMRSCVADEIRAGNNDVITELMKTLEKLMK